MNPTSTLLLASLLATTANAAAPPNDSIPSVVVTLENEQPSRGVLLTPPWIGIHDGSFDSYDGGSPAGTPLGGDQIERLAEDGNNGPITAAFDALLPGAPQVGGAVGPFGPLAPGDRVSVTLNVDPSLDRYFSYASMVIPSNDTFIANGNPLAHRLFDDAGNFVGEGFLVSGGETNDAGTEVNDELAGNVAFLHQGGPDVGVPQNGVVVTPSPGFAAPGTLTYPDGVLNYPAFGNAEFNTPDDRILSVRFRYVDLGGFVRFSTRLRASDEVQAEVVDSPAGGLVRARSLGGDALRVQVRYDGLTGPLQGAHLHLGQAGTNGPIVVDLAPGLVGGSNVILLVSAADLAGPLAGRPFLELLNELAAGNVYVNLHTAQFPAGEIRGQLELSD